TPFVAALKPWWPEQSRSGSPAKSKPGKLRIPRPPGVMIMPRRPTVTAFSALLVAAAAAIPAFAAPKSEPPYHGLWGSNAKACRDPDGVSRLEINPNGFYWYETRCKAAGITPDGPQAWRMRLACEGEGEKFQK